MRAPAFALASLAYVVCCAFSSRVAAEDPALTNKTDNLDLVVKVHKRIIDSLKEKSPADMKPYKATIPGTDASFEMVPVPGGDYVMGSSDSEAGRNPDEGPQHKVKIEPFWMGKYEVIWNEYEPFVPVLAGALSGTPVKTDGLIDAMTRPTPPYVDMTFSMGKKGYPAISMTQHAANKYCQWLSTKTGQFYRLPTEAEWEYACRAGTKTAYSFGDDASQLKDYAWFEENGDGRYQKVGKKKPNPWGLYDMHGNVAEWCLDEYVADYYQQFKDKVAAEPWKKSTRGYPQVVRGGSWDDAPESLRSAARRQSDKSWKARDPQLPQSIWWMTDAKFLGMRIIRPLKVPPPEEMRKFWTSGVERQ